MTERRVPDVKKKPMTRAWPPDVLETRSEVVLGYLWAKGWVALLLVNLLFLVNPKQPTTEVVLWLEGIPITLILLPPE